MECNEDCTCGSDCRNQRLRRKQWSDVAVIRTEKKGYGLRINTDIEANTLIFEYVGEVIGEQAFHVRREKYHKEGIKHFYFMTLTSTEFVDATKKGNLGRFCNHSCNPNCYVDKWTVDDRLRMGIYSERRIEAGEELTFNYNVDRYGADPTPCYCGEENCTGYLGGKTQTERATKLPALTVEALGIEDADDWDTAVAKRGRGKKKTGEADEEYVDRVQPKSLDESAVTKVMATLRQCKEKWIVVKLLTRLQEAEDDRVRGRVVRMHGYLIFKSALSTWGDDANVILQICDILQRLPMITRNKIQDSKIEEVMQGLTLHEDERVKEKASNLMSTWSKLEVGYRIQKRVPGANPEQDRQDKEDRRQMMMRERGHVRERTRSPSPAPPRGPSIPTGPRSGPRPTQRPSGYFNGPPRHMGPRPPPPSALPAGWLEASNSKGEKYYYNSFGGTTWDRPTAPAGAPPPPPKISKQNQAYQDIIKDILSKPAPTPEPKQPSKPQVPARDTSINLNFSTSSLSDTKREDPKSKDWRDWPERHQKKTYANTIQPIVAHIMNKYSGKMPKDAQKRFAKQVSQIVVDGDFKKNRIQDPKKLTDKAQSSIHKFVSDYFSQAAKKLKDYEKRDKEKKAAAQEAAAKSDSADVKMSGITPASSTTPATPAIAGADADVDVDADAIEVDLAEMSTTPDDSLDSDHLKRKREADETPLTGISPGDEEMKDNETLDSPKRLCVDHALMSIPPPPPPPRASDDEPVLEKESDADKVVRAVGDMDGGWHAEPGTDEGPAFQA